MNRVAIIQDLLRNEIFNRPQIDGKDNIKITENEIAHAYCVSLICRLLAKKRKLKVEIASIIGYLHDIGRIRNNIITKEHAKIGSENARNILIETNVFTEAEINIICTAILRHGNKETIDDEYDELIKDADAFERSYHYSNSSMEIQREARELKVLTELSIE